MAGPITFVKEHPVGFIGSAAFGMIAGPWVLGKINQYTGISIGVPSFGRGRNSGSDS